MPRPSLLVAATLAVLLPACGHRGDPLPPRRRTPPPLQDFRLAQRGDVLELRAIAPGASTDGVPYEAVTVEFLHVEGQKDLEKAGSRRAVRALPGQRVAFTLPLPAPGTLVRAAARGIAGKERGPRTLTMALVAQAPLEAPRELTAVLAEDGVALQWLGLRPKEIPPPVLAPTPGGPPVAGPPNPFAPAPPKPAAPAPPKPAAPAETGKEPEGAEKAGGAPVTEGVVAGPRRSGFFVYRRVGGAEYAEPLAEEPLERRTYQDASAPLGATVCYVVRAVGSTQPLVESAPSNEACVAVRDVAAPATPAGLAVLPREGGLEVLWSPSAEPDLAGYRVYRTAPGGPREKAAEAATNRSAWLDETARRGVVYRYAVTAVDQAGNESEPTEEVEASLP